MSWLHSGLRIFCKETIVLPLLKQFSGKQFPSVVGETEYFPLPLTNSFLFQYIFRAVDQMKLGFWGPGNCKQQRKIEMARIAAACLVLYRQRMAKSSKWTCLHCHTWKILINNTVRTQLKLAVENRTEETGLFMGQLLVQTGNRPANLACRARHLLLFMLLMERRGKEVAMTSAVIVHPSAPGHILVAAVSLSLQGFSIRWSWQWNHSHISAHSYPSRVLSYPTETTCPCCRTLIKPYTLLLRCFP